MSQFNNKIFNPEVFGTYVERVPNLKRNELLKAGVLNLRNDIKALFNPQTGGNYATIPLKGLIDGAPVNYDGSTDITSTSTKTFSQGMVVIGRAKAWTEKDFSFDITGEDFMDNVIQQLAQYWDGIDQDTLLSVLKGIFSMTGAGNLDFVNNHTYDITDADTTADANAKKVGAATLNSASQKASGDNKQTFNVVIMHSTVATNVENLNLITYLKYTDANGIQRDLGLGTLNGKLVFIDDNMPTANDVTTKAVYSTKIDTAAVATDKITIANTEYTFVANDATDTATQIKIGAAGTAAQQATNIAAKLNAQAAGVKDTYTITASQDKVLFTAKSSTEHTAAPVVTVPSDDTIKITNATDTAEVMSIDYTTYVLGTGAFDYADVGAKIPYEVDRDPKTNGGEDTLYTRQRKLFAPKGISFIQSAMAGLSPTDTELETGASWELVNDGQATKGYINHKAIPIARIISKG